MEVDYAQLALPNTSEGLSEAGRIIAGADRCEDLYALIKGPAQSQISRQTSPVGQVPRDIAIELAKLDPGEMSVGLRRSDAIVFLMLCGRVVVPEVPEGAEPLTRDQIRTQVLNQKLALAADGYLRKLRAAAVIREP